MQINVPHRAGVVYIALCASSWRTRKRFPILVFRFLHGNLHKEYIIVYLARVTRYIVNTVIKHNADYPVTSAATAGIDDIA